MSGCISISELTLSSSSISTVDFLDPRVDEGNVDL